MVIENPRVWIIEVKGLDRKSLQSERFDLFDMHNVSRRTLKKVGKVEKSKSDYLL